MLLTFCHYKTKIPFLQYRTTFPHFSLSLSSILFKDGQALLKVNSRPLMFSLTLSLGASRFFLLPHPKSHCYILRHLCDSTPLQARKFALVMYYCVTNHLKTKTMLLFFIISLDQEFLSKFLDGSGLRSCIKMYLLYFS